jgi:hypothetical protein
MFGTRWFGYDRSEVDEMMKQVDLYATKLEGELKDAQERIRELEAETEQFEVRMAALRRERRAATTGDNSQQQSITIILGPASTFAKIAVVADDVESVDCLSIRFRVFRDGFYRIDAMTDKLQVVVAWFEEHPGTREVRVDQETIHVILK